MKSKRKERAVEYGARYLQIKKNQIERWWEGDNLIEFLCQAKMMKKKDSNFNDAEWKSVETNKLLIEKNESIKCWNEGKNAIVYS